MIHYDGIEVSDIDEIFETLAVTDDYGNKTWVATEEEIYKLWHDYNVWTLFNAYTPWLDTMYDCDYAQPEKITILGESFTVQNPLDPTAYFTMDEHGNMNAGRYMVFSRSEMKYYGLTEAQLTQVERKIIELQDNVYNNAIKLMDYYKMSDETLIQSYAMLQLFEFNKVFSQTSLVSESFEMFPQSYELKAFSYDAYMRLIVAEASGESLMYSEENTNTNVGIYERVMKNTSIFFGVALIINDFIAVYLIPILKLFFLVMIFSISILLITAASIQLEFNLVNVMWKSIASPLISYGAVSIGMAYLVSLFMSNGADGITGGSLTISVGNPTTAVILMIIINVAVLVLYWKICKKCFKDFTTYIKAVADNISSAVVGAVGKVTGSVIAGKANHRIGRAISGVSSSAKQRGFDNLPTSGKRTKRHSLKPVAVGVGVGAGSQAVKAVAGMNKYDQKALGKANMSIGKASTKADIARHKLEKAVASGASTDRIAYLNMKANMAQASLDKKKEYANAIVNVGRYGARGIQIKNKYDKLSSNAKGVGRSIKQFNTDFQSGALGYKAGISVSSNINRVEAGIRNTGNTIKRGALKTVHVATAPIRVGKKVVRNVADGSVQRGVTNTAKKGVNMVHETGANIVKNREEFKNAYKFNRSSMKNHAQFHKTT